MGRGLLPGEGAKQRLSLLPTLLGELPVSAILANITLFPLLEVKRWRMSLQKDVY